MTPGCLADIIRFHSTERPDAPALDLADRSLTFAELDARSSQLANAAAALGVGNQDHVAFIDKNGIEGYEVIFGLGKINAVNISVNWRLAPPEMAQIIDDSKSKVLIVGPDFIGHVEQIENDLVTVEHIVAIGGHERWTDYEDWLADQRTTDPGAEPEPEDVAFQLYTSGTTGLPKGVMLTNANLFTLTEQVGEQWNLGPESVNLALMPMFHIGGIGWAVVGLYFGTRTIVIRDVDPAKLLEIIPRFKVTVGFMVPAVIQFLLITPGVENTDFSSLRTIVYGASPISDTVLVEAMKRLGCGFIQVYGLTETTGAITQLDAADHDPDHRPELLRSCGKPYPWVEVRLVDVDSGDDVALGQPGELWIRSPQVMKGYWDNPEATRASITPDGFFKTGDVGFSDAEGFLYLHDRVKDMIVSGGENVYPTEVENVLMRHPAVSDVAVIGVPDEKWGEAVKAIVVRAEGADPGADELIAYARQNLAGYKLPKSVDFATDLPRNPSGKLLKRELRQPYWEGAKRQIG